MPRQRQKTLDHSAAPLQNTRQTDLVGSLGLKSDRLLAKPPASIALPFTLHTRSPMLCEVAEVAGVALCTPPARLSRQAVENLFNRLSNQIHRPGATDTALPQRAEWAAALLILREGLHHWGVEWVELG